MPRLLRRAIPILIALALIAAIAYALIPRPVEVETAVVSRGPLRITVNEDGQTRIKERYVVAAPLAGRLSRITLDPGDAVIADETILATIDPGDPALLDPRARAQAQARVAAAEAALKQAEATLARAAAALEQAQDELARQRQLAARGGGNQKELDDAATTEAMRAAEHRAAGFAVEIARFELEQARAALLHSSTEQPDADGDWRFEIRAPVSGRVLRVFQESSAVVTPGTPLLEVGDPTDLEAEIDVLSSEAVAIRPGQHVYFEQWGGDQPLNGVVRLVEPSAFTKISALGVEEQRVWVIIDFTDPPEVRASLGDGFRVEARIVVWEEPDVLKIPAGALFRTADTWAVFAIENGRARTRAVTVGRRNPTEAQILAGLAEGELVIAYPSDRVHDGVRVTPRRALAGPRP